MHKTTTMDDVLTPNIERELNLYEHQARSSAKNAQDEMNEEDLNRQSKRMQDLIEQIDLLPASESKELMRQCLGEILTFYGNGLERIMEILMNEGNKATKILNDLLEDSFINGLLIIHDLHPFDLKTRLNLALEKVRPYIQSHGGNVELISLEKGSGSIKLSGSCKSCASSSVTLELAIKQSIEEHCPDLLQLNVEGVESSSNQDNDHLRKEKRSPSGWKQVNGLDGLRDGEMKFIEVSGIQLVICKINDQLFAYKNCCPACDLPLSTGQIEGEVISCRLGHRYDIRHAGACLDDSKMHLDPFPLIREDDAVKISVVNQSSNAEQ